MNHKQLVDEAKAKRVRYEAQNSWANAAALVEMNVRLCDAIEAATTPAPDTSAIIAGAQGFLDAWNADADTVRLEAAKEVLQRTLATLKGAVSQPAPDVEETPEARAVMGGFFEGSRLAFQRFCLPGKSWKEYDEFRDSAWEKSDSRRQILEPAETVGEAISRSMGDHWAQAAKRAELAPAPDVAAEAEIGLGPIASIAHDGGLASLSEAEALTAIRALTVQHWDQSGSESDRALRVGAAISVVQP